MNTRLPPGASSSCRFRSDARRSLTACSTFVPMMKSNEPASKPCSVPGFSRSRILNSTSGKARELLHGAGEKRRRDIAEGVGVQPALEQRQHVRGSPPVPAPTSRMRSPRPSGRSRAASCTAAAIAASQWLV